MERFRYFLLIFSAFSQLLFSQETKTFSEIRKSYEKKDIDDTSALPEVERYIRKAKSELHFTHLIQGYRDGRQFDRDHKLQYADSALLASRKYGSSDDISRDYLSKGIIYYFYKRNYRQALNEYMMAYQYLKDSDDEFLRYKILYHLGIVKGHLGYYDEALTYFRQCIEFYGERIKDLNHENDIFNHQKAYFNSLHQLTVINRYLHNYKESDSLSRLGYKLTVNHRDFVLENSYFLKCIGISRYHDKDYKKARDFLKQSLPAMIKRNDFAWVSVVYFYLGKTDAAENNPDGAILYFDKIDSIFNKEKFVIPESYPGYTYLINHYKKVKKLKKQLYYTNQLLKADSLIDNDYPYLSSKLHRDYDRRTLIDEKESLEKASKNKILVAKLLLVSASLLLIFFMYRYYRERKIRNQYEILQKKLVEQDYLTAPSRKVSEAPAIRKTSLTPVQTEDIRKKLQKFEDELMFLKKGLSEKIVSDMLDTNSHYLSVYINENKGINFNRYLAELRINYITHLLNTDTEYLKYTIESLSKECGIAARQNFSKLFFEINGIRPRDYIKNRKKDLDRS